ncbi:hypothetical protein GH714_036802 [Hevea brasiliensis]|uniref:Cytochrome P450 n=1 Tax=Hevea brasiliensis TaxID=3981 RepID=A0A6A6KQ05_HEVBR|nr:hypothetical protein GH714_036802 [Hevea brasiliensis]
MLLPFLPVCLYFYLLYTSQNKLTKKGFKIYPIVGALPELLRNRHRFLDWTTETLVQCPTNTAVLRRPGNVHGVFTANPLNVEYILKTNFDNYPKGGRFISHLEDFLGRGIFNSDGDLWKVQRKTASYEFNTKSLRNFVMDNVRIEISTRLLPILSRASKTNQVLDFQELLERFAFDNICKLAFNVDPGCLGGDGTAGGEFMRAFEEAATLSTGRFMYAFPSYGNSLATVMIVAGRYICWEGLVCNLPYVRNGEDESIWARIADCSCLKGGFRRMRFADKRAHLSSRFHAGPRMCLGKDMAYIQMKAIAASVLERFELDVQNKEKCPEHLLSLTLRMKGGLQVKVKERCADSD